MFLFLCRVCSHLLLPVTGGAEHVQDVSEPLTCVAHDCPGHPIPRPAHQGQRARPYRRGGTHVHQQPGDAHQVPGVQVSHSRQVCRTLEKRVTDPELL